MRSGGSAASSGDDSAGSYQPMLRLLDVGDFVFLRAQPGFTPEMESRLRTQRIRIFRSYLRGLDGEFRRISSHIRRLAAGAGQERRHMLWSLTLQRTAFIRQMATVQARLLFYTFGWGTVDASSLLKVFETLKASAQPPRASMALQY